MNLDAHIVRFTSDLSIYLQFLPTYHVSERIESSEERTIQAGRKITYWNKVYNTSQLSVCYFILYASLVSSFCFLHRQFIINKSVVEKLLRAF